MSIYSNICSISWEKFFSCDCSTCMLCASCSDESITSMDAVSSICAYFTSSYSCSYYASFSLLRNSCSSLSCCFNSYNSFFDSSSFSFSLCLCEILQSHTHLFASISKVSISKSGFSLNLLLCSTCALSTTFLLPLLRTCLIPYTTSHDASLWDVATFYNDNHSTTILMGSLSLEKL